MTPVLILVGALSTYHVGDGMSGTELACGGRFDPAQEHVAIRQWRGRCGLPTRVCAAATKRCVWTTVRDSGPWGAVDDKGVWRVWPRPLPQGWRRRGVVDLTGPLWIRLGRPPFLSPVTVEVFDDVDRVARR